MTGEAINLRQARKARDRKAAKVRADGNAARHGRTKAEREAEDADARRSDAHLNAHRIEGED